MNATRPTKRMCVIHPDRLAHVDAVGIAICDECWTRYLDERWESNGEPSKRPFLRELVAREHDLNS